MTIKIHLDAALIIVDLQNDFCPGGALPVPEGYMIVPILNRYLERFYKAGAPVFATRDWHPPNHLSFKEAGGLWPPHCIQGTPGAAFHPDLRLSETVEIISKGDDPARDAYSSFQGTGFATRLRKGSIQWLFVGGLATDYCVKATVLDAIKKGFEVYLLEDAIRAVNIHPEDVQHSIDEMKSAGANLIDLDALEDTHEGNTLALVF